MPVEAKRNARIEITAGTAGMDRGLSDARRKLRMMEREQTSAVKKAAAADARAAKHSAAVWGRARSAVGSGIGMSLGGDLTSQFSEAVRGVADFERELTRFQIDAQLSGSKIGMFRDQVMAASKATGQSRIEVLKGAHAYQILTGDAQGAIRSSKLFAEVANASGASMDDIATAAASLHNNLNLNAGDFRGAFDVILSMGHKSTVELRSMAAEMNRLSPLIRDFGASSNVNKLAEMAASLETAAPAFKGSADEQAAAAEGLQQLMLTLRKIPTMKNFDQLGVKIWQIDPKTKQHVLRDWFDIIGDIKKKVPDQLMLEAAVGGKGQAYLALEEMLAHYDKLVNLKNEALGSDQVAKDNAVYMNSATGKMALAWTQIKNAIAEALTPGRIDAFASAIKNVVPAVTAAASMVSKIVGGLGQIADVNNLSKSDDETANLTTQDMYKAARGGKTNADIVNKAALDIVENPRGQQATMEAGMLRAHPQAHDFAAVLRGAINYLKAQGLYHEVSITGRALTPADAPQVKALARAIGAEVAAALQRSPIKIGAEPVQKGAANSIEHRRGRSH